MHLNPWQFIYALLLGLSLGWIFWRTGSLWLCVLHHGLYNGLVLGFLLFPQNSRGTTDTFDSGPSLQPLWRDAGGLVLFVAGAWWLRRHTVPPAWAERVLESTPEELPPVLPPPLPPDAQ